MKRKVLIVLLVLFAAIAAVYWVLDKSVEAPAPSDSAQTNSTETIEDKTNEPQTAPAFDKNKYSVDDPSSIWVVVNKKRPLPAGYAPNDLSGQLRGEVSAKLSELITAAKNAGVNYKIISGYRSYGAQSGVYNSYVQKDGAAKADTYSARPGHSEHQTGLAADLGTGQCDLEICFGDTAGGRWLAENAHKYGFIISYPTGKETITGYQYEPWHTRYVGTELASELKKQGQTMQEFFGLPAAPNY